jgi:hypothetical protein
VEVNQPWKFQPASRSDVFWYSTASTNGLAVTMIGRTCARCLASATRGIEMASKPRRILVRPISTSTRAFARAKPSVLVSERMGGPPARANVDAHPELEESKINGETYEELSGLPADIPLPNERYLSSWTVSRAC